MNIWTCKRNFVALAVVVGLAACSEGPTTLSFLQAPESAPKAKRIPNTALASAKMLRGAVTLLPPEGYCIDRRSLRQSFAAMARCDTLGARGTGAFAPLGLITASFVTLPPSEASAGDLLRAAVPAGSEVLSDRSDAPIAHMKLSGATVAGASETYWKGMSKIGGGLMAVSVYAPPDTELLGNTGARLLEDTVSGTTAASVAEDVAGKTPPEGNSPLASLGSLIGGLFQ